MLQAPLPSASRRTRSATVTFLRDRCSHLQRALVGDVAEGDVTDEVLEGDVLRRWTTLLLPADPWPPATQLALEELYILHARVVERAIRGGVGDISPEVEHLARAVWIDRLQRATDRAVTMLG